MWPSNGAQHRFLVHEMRVVALRRILWLSLMPIAAFYGFHFQGYPFDSHFAGGSLSGSECSPRLVAISLVAISPVAIFLAVTVRRAVLMSRRKDRPCLSRHRRRCRFVRVAEGFRAEKAVFVPRHRQDGQMARVVAGRHSSVAFRGDAFRSDFRRLPFVATPFAKVRALWRTPLVTTQFLCL